MEFSIIIPTYNSASTLKTCLNSIVSQTYPNYEVLIVDNLSIDNTLEIGKSFNDARIKIFSEKDKGIYDAMNKGILLAKGNWLYFLGSDDRLFDNDVLQDTINFINNTKSLIIYGNVKIQGDAGWATDGQIYDGEFDLGKLLKKNIAHQCIFYSKKVIKAQNYNLEYNVCADYDLNLKLFSKYNFEYFDRIIADFTGGGYSVISKDDNFIMPEVIIKHFYYYLWRKEFFSFRNGIKYYGDNEFSFLKKIYIYFVYFKHRLLKTLI